MPTLFRDTLIFTPHHGICSLPRNLLLAAEKNAKTGRNAELPVFALFIADFRSKRLLVGLSDDVNLEVYLLCTLPSRQMSSHLS